MSLKEFVVHPAHPVDPCSIFSELAEYPVALLSDNLFRTQGCKGLLSLGAPVKFAGNAVTVKTRPGDNLIIYKALMQLLPGHVLVIDGGGDLNNALVGDLMMQYSIQRGCVGFVVDGAVRDRSEFIAAGFPCHARGVNHRGPYKNGPGQINVPVAIGGHIISPGDYVVADEDGVLSFPPADAPALLEAVRQSRAKEQKISAEIALGHADQSWLKAVLSAKGLA
jgi:RraA family protein